MRYAFLLISASVAWLCSAQEPLVIHEWGTFTSLQNEDGAAIAGVNSDDEPVPAFCHEINHTLIGHAEAKGIPRLHPDVTMRLETPVIYFHPAKDTQLPLSLNLSVEFHGGWLTQFYPAAQSDAPGLSGKEIGRLKRDTVGKLSWNGLLVGTKSPGPNTEDRVWLAPRNVEAADVTVLTRISHHRIFSA